MFKKTKKKLNHRKNLRIIIDILGAIAVWWGTWGLLDVFIFPGNQILSYLISIALGFLLLLMGSKGLNDFK